MSGIRFKTRARTIDHLGRRQIADCPTAISELWKNAYDAYARDVALHIFDTQPPMAAIVDTGHGMNRDEYIERWLTIGTDSKVGEGARVPVEDRDGLAERIRQGEKGIGRLSVAFLGPMVVLISKRSTDDFVASLIDWRVFENPYLNLEDIVIPVESFAQSSEVIPAVWRMQNAFTENVWPEHGDTARIERIKQGWKRYDAQLGATGQPRASEQVMESLIAVEALSEEQLRVWKTYTGEKQRGTALFVLNIHDELRVWLTPSDQDEEKNESRMLLRDTLLHFIDPYSAATSDAVAMDDFSYEAVAHSAGRNIPITSSEEALSLDELLQMEHVVEGRVDEKGVFRGRVRVFGEWQPTVVLTPQRMPPAHGSGYVGPFHFLVGTVEQDQKKSSHSAADWARYMSLSQEYGGFAIYRDRLRIMPYGRARGDLFDIDERRGKHQGRHFWAYRRMVGRLKLSRDENPNLIDKAGREGFIDNNARREFRLLVIDHLMSLARKYFGTDAPAREQIIKANEERYQQELKKALRRSKRELRTDLKNKSPQLDEWLEQAERIAVAVKSAAASGALPDLQRLGDDMEQLRIKKRELKLGDPPRDLPPEDEIQYRSYRNRLQQYNAKVDEALRAYNSAVGEIQGPDPTQLAQEKFNQYQTSLRRSLSHWKKKVDDSLEQERQRLTARFEQDQARFFEESAGLIRDVQGGQLALSKALARFEQSREDLLTEFAERYESYLNALARLQEDVNVEGTLRWSADEVEALKKQVARVHELAQLGVTVEIIGHEFETLDGQVRRNLGKLPKDIQQSDAFGYAKRAHEELMTKLRFLTPLKLSGTRFRETILGSEIESYLRSFYADQWAKNRNTLLVTDAFRKIRIKDFRSRIYPVFINMLNNSLYWIASKQERVIQLDCMEDDVIVSDSGPGVDPDDVPHLFELFFTRKSNGRGVGLYLCKENLNADNHRIEYASKTEHRLLSGANFVISFRGIEHG